MEESEDQLEIDAPPGLLPDLTDYGIEEVERGVCLDTAENRRALRANNLRWVPVYRASGDDTPYIQAVTSEMNEARSLVTKKLILKDARDVDSDYITGLALLLEPQVEGFVPSWVFAMTRQWSDIEEERQRRRLAGEPKVYRPKIVGPPVRCRAYRMDGHRCQNWCGNLLYQDGYCKLHVNSDQRKNFAPSTVERAKLKAANLAERSMEGLAELAETATSEPVRLQAYNSLLDRAGVRGGSELEVKGTVELGLAENLIRERLNQIRKNSEPKELTDGEAEETEAEIIVEAEVIEVQKNE